MGGAYISEKQPPGEVEPTNSFGLIQSQEWAGGWAFEGLRSGLITSAAVAAFPFSRWSWHSC